MILNDAEVDLPEVDLCIVGAGPVGVALALRSAELGLRVILLEAGQSNTAPDASEHLGQIESLGRHHADMGVVSRRGLGGTSALWGGRCVAFDDLDFEVRDHVDFSGWPIPHSEIKAHYRSALDFLNCGTNDSDAEPREDAPEPVQRSALERWSAEPNIARLYEQRLRTSAQIWVMTNTTAIGLELDADGNRAVGIKVVRGKTTLQVRAAAYALCSGGLGNARLLLQCQRDWPLKFGGIDGPLGRFYQGHLTGYIALIAFADRQAEAALDFRKDAKGRHYRNRLQISPQTQRENALLNSVFWLEALSVADPAHASGALSAIYLGMYYSGFYRRFANGLAPKSVATMEKMHRVHFQNIRRDPHFFTNLSQATRSLLHRRLTKWGTLPNPAGRYLLRYHAEQAPNPESRVRLDGTQNGALLPKLMVDYRIDHKDTDSIVRSHRLLDAWLRENGIGRLEYLKDDAGLDQAVLDQALDGYHQIGLTRMSEDTRTGVVNRDSRVHDVANLYVAGSSVFPTGGQANPTLPAVALALRLAAHLGSVPKSGAL